MPVYVDGFLLPVPKKNLAAYKRMAKLGAKVWMEHGALEYRECVGDDLTIKGMLGFPKVIKPKAGETVVFSYITYKSRADRDRINAKVMKDPRLAQMCSGKSMPFDCKRMAMGGFTTLVSG
ncbi:MAG: DUF1428 domain-containing protein [Phycisphaerales bacterium]